MGDHLPNGLPGGPDGLPGDALPESELMAGLITFCCQCVGMFSTFMLGQVVGIGRPIALDSWMGSNIRPDLNVSIGREDDLPLRRDFLRM